jgi:hypothetical protein
VGLFVMGVAYHVIPRFAGTPLVGSGGVPWSFWLQLTGVLTIATSHLVSAPRPIVVAGGLALVGASVLFAQSIGRTLRRAAPSPEPFERWLLAGCGWLVASAILATIAVATADVRRILDPGCRPPDLSRLSLLGYPVAGC